MPLLRIDVIKGRTETETRALLDAIHRGMVAAFDVPERDRYQVLNEHEPSHMVMEDTGLGIPRSKHVVFIQVTSRRRSCDKKEKFYKAVCEELKTACMIEATDIIFSMVENADEDWSFGHGRAQFLTGEL